MLVTRIHPNVQPVDVITSTRVESQLAHQENGGMYNHRRDLAMSLLELFCDVDDFMLRFRPQWKAEQLATGKQRERAGQLCPKRRS